MFSGKDVPAVGVSIGIERVFAILERRLTVQAKHHGAAIRETQTQASAHIDFWPMKDILVTVYQIHISHHS